MLSLLINPVVVSVGNEISARRSASGGNHLWSRYDDARGWGQM